MQAETAAAAAPGLLNVRAVISVEVVGHATAGHVLMVPVLMVTVLITVVEAAAMVTALGLREQLPALAMVIFGMALRK